MSFFYVHLSRFEIPYIENVLRENFLFLADEEKKKGKKLYSLCFLVFNYPGGRPEGQEWDDKKGRKEGIKGDTN